MLDGHTFAEFVLVWCGGGQRRAAHDPDAVRNKINRQRAERGLPPMRKPTAAEIAAAHKV